MLFRSNYDLILFTGSLYMVGNIRRRLTVLLFAFVYLLYRGEKMLKIRGFKKNFGKNEVLKGIDLDVTAGEVVVIIGPSGSGKSTLLRCLNLLETPSEGQIFYHSVDLLSCPPKESNAALRKMGMVFQQFNLFPHLTAMDNITLAPICVQNVTRKEARKKALEDRKIHV